MAVLKCEICGGNMIITRGSNIGRCDSCGRDSTITDISNERKVNLFNRAVFLRLQKKYDEAYRIYASVLEEDNTDAEAHWGAVLCRYGIEYVEDPVSHEHKPTCNRIQFVSITSDADYLAALANAADYESRELYQRQAEEIAEIQKEFLAISQQEEPYDIFICYKETSDNNERTRDSVIAQDIYSALTDKGYKVFFSRITLEDKLGQQYEPYIFAALQSSRVMLVIGTRPEYFEAVWVKNEWSRYLLLMKEDHNRLLIPCYRDMDPYELPVELSALQSQDMSKIGFMQDLIRGIEKVVGDKNKTASYEASPNDSALTDQKKESALLRRASLFLDTGDWEKAAEYADRVLDENPENASAYLMKLMADYRVRNFQELANQEASISGNKNYQLTMRFADPSLARQLTSMDTAIVERNNASIANATKAQAAAWLQNANSLSEFYNIFSMLEPIANYEGVLDLIAEVKKRKDTYISDCYNQAKTLMKHEDWANAVIKFNEINSVYDCTNETKECMYQQGKKLFLSQNWDAAVTIFSQISDYRDSNSLIKKCRKLEKKAGKRLVKKYSVKKTKPLVVFLGCFIPVYLLSYFLFLNSSLYAPLEKWIRSNSTINGLYRSYILWYTSVIPDITAKTGVEPNPALFRALPWAFIVSLLLTIIICMIKRRKKR